MVTKYYPFQIALTDGQKQSLRKALASRTAVTLRVKPGQIGRGDTLLLTTTQIKHEKKAASEKHGADITMSQTQIAKLAQSGGNLFSTVFSLARPLLASAAKSAAKALAAAGLSLAADKALKEIFGKGYGPREVELYRLTQMLSPDQRKAIERHLIGKGMVRGGGSAQYGGFLGMLASIGVPLALSLVKSLVGKGMQVGRPRSRRSVPCLPPPALRGGKGMQISPPWYRPPPVWGTWGDCEKKK